MSHEILGFLPLQLKMTNTAIIAIIISMLQGRKLRHSEGLSDLLVVMQWNPNPESFTQQLAAGIEKSQSPCSQGAYIGQK